MRLVTSLLVVGGYISATLGSTIPDVETGIAGITAVAELLDSQITAFPLTGGSLLSAIAMHATTGTLASAIDSATGDVEARYVLLLDFCLIAKLDHPPIIIQGVSPSTIPEGDALRLLGRFSALQPLIEKTLNDMKAKKSAFIALPFEGLDALIVEDLENLRSSASGLESAFLAHTPPSLHAEASIVASSINSAFGSAIAAFS